MTEPRDLALPTGYTDLLGELKDRVRAARTKALRTVNTQLIELYWSIGWIRRRTGRGLAGEAGPVGAVRAHFRDRRKMAQCLNREDPALGRPTPGATVAADSRRRSTQRLRPIPGAIYILSKEGAESSGRHSAFMIEPGSNEKSGPAAVIQGGGDPPLYLTRRTRPGPGSSSFPARGRACPWSRLLRLGCRSRRGHRPCGP